MTEGVALLLKQRTLDVLETAQLAIITGGVEE